MDYELQSLLADYVRTLLFHGEDINTIETKLYALADEALYNVANEFDND